MAAYSMYDSFTEYISMFNKAVEDGNSADAIRIGRKLVQIADDECKRPEINATMKKTYSENSQRAREYLVDMRVNTVGGTTSMKKPESKVRKCFSVEVPKLTLRDLKGNQDLKNEFITNILAPQSPKYGSIYGKYRGTEFAAQILLAGPPGTGKTFAVKCLAGSLKCHIAVVRSKDILANLVGDAPKNLSAVFEEAKQYDRCIIFFDEIDALCASRDDEESRHTKDVLVTLLEEMDGFTSNAEKGNHRIIIAATNRPWILDAAIKRGGRFDTQIYMPPPDYDARYQLIKLALGKDESVKDRVNVPCAEGVSIEWLADMFDGMSGADIKAVCRQAINKPLQREISSMMNHGEAKSDAVSREDFETVFRNYINSITDEMLLQFDAYFAGMELSEYIKIIKEKAVHDRDSVPEYALRHIDKGMDL
jgi:transitional endoplasmic reticulum ATPase